MPWWESSLLRTSYEDRLIDAWIGLEALLHHKYPGRLANLLGANEADATVMKTNAGISYGWRSKIVHAEDPTKVARRMPLQEVVLLTTGYLRSALLKVLVLPGTFDPNSL